MYEVWRACHRSEVGSGSSLGLGALDVSARRVEVGSKRLDVDALVLEFLL